LGIKITSRKATKATDAYGVTKYVIGFTAGAIPNLVEFFPIVKIKNKEYTCERTLSKNNFDPVAGYNEAGLSLDYAASGGSSCGDGSIEADLGEECDFNDGANYIFPDGDNNCATYFDNYVSGDLICTTGCTFDAANCQVGGSGDSGNGETTPDNSGGTPSNEEEIPIVICGDEIIAGSEICDTTEFGTLTCADFGFDAGYLICEPDCLNVDTSYCRTSVSSICNNGIIEGTEVCDGINLNGKNCLSFGFTEGALACKSDCTGFDTSECKS